MTYFHYFFQTIAGVLTMERPIDLRPTRLNCTLQDLFRDTHLNIFGEPKNAYLVIFGGSTRSIPGIFARISLIFLARQGEMIFYFPILSRCCKKKLLFSYRSTRLKQATNHARKILRKLSKSWFFFSFQSLRLKIINLNLASFPKIVGNFSWSRLEAWE